jgi:hypothetical protein
VAEPNGGTGWPDDPVHKIQAAAEDVAVTGTVELRGRTFKLGPNIGESGAMSMLQFAEAASDGIGAQDMVALATMNDLLRSCFMVTPSCGTCEACDAEEYSKCEKRDEGDWPRFTRFARAVSAGAEELFAVVRQAVEQVTARPTQLPPGSSRQQPPLSANLRDSSSLPEAFRKAELIDVGEVLRSTR